jgi:CTP synthase
VIEAVRHASAYHGVKPAIDYIDAQKIEGGEIRPESLEEYDGIIIPGGFGSMGVEGKIEAIRYAREHDIPLLGLCYGFQLSVVEFARHVCGLEDAHTTEVNPRTKHPVIDLLPWHRKVLKEKGYGATMRLGGQEVIIKPGTLAHKLYGREVVVERFRHRYEVNPKYVELIEEKGLIFSGESRDGIKQIGELEGHPYFIGSQFHPEFTSRPLKPNPLFVGFIEAAIRRSKK